MPDVEQRKNHLTTSFFECPPVAHVAHSHRSHRIWIIFHLSHFSQIWITCIEGFHHACLINNLLVFCCIFGNKEIRKFLVIYIYIYMDHMNTLKLAETKFLIWLGTQKMIPQRITLGIIFIIA